MDEAGSRRRRRSRGSKAPTRPWSIAAPERATADETILELLERGAEAHGFREEAWTCKRVAIVIRREFLGSATIRLSCKSFAQSLEAQPAQAAAPGESKGRGGHRALERREVAFPQKRALKEGRTIVFADQSGFYVLPMVVRTSYAPVGKTPILKENLTRDHLLRR